MCSSDLEGAASLRSPRAPFAVAVESDAFGKLLTAQFSLFGLTEGREYKFVRGFPGGAEIMLAVRRGEIDFNIARIGLYRQALVTPLSPRLTLAARLNLAALLRSPLCGISEEELFALAYGRKADLWSALGNAANLPVPAVMRTWVTQTGYPVVDASASGDDLTLKQERFTYDHITNPAPDSTQWLIPVRAARQSGGSVETVVEAPQVSLKLAGSGWTKVNAGQTGFYRVNYTADQWDALTEAVRAQQLPAVDRLGLQSDCWALVRGGYLPATQFLKLADAYVGETDATVWGDLASCLASLENMILAEPFLGKLDAYGQRLFTPILEKVGWEIGRAHV